MLPECRALGTCRSLLVVGMEGGLKQLQCVSTSASNQRKTRGVGKDPSDNPLCAQRHAPGSRRLLSLATAPSPWNSCSLWSPHPVPHGCRPWNLLFSSRGPPCPNRGLTVGSCARLSHPCIWPLCPQMLFYRCSLDSKPLPRPSAHGRKVCVVSQTPCTVLSI